LATLYLGTVFCGSGLDQLFSGSCTGGFLLGLLFLSGLITGQIEASPLRRESRLLQLQSFTVQL
jgi:hypothetical protein